MYRIVEKRVLNSLTKLIKVEAPYVARKALPGQFVMLRINEDGERIPLTVSDYDREAGTVTLVFQEVGKTTKMLGALEAGDSLLDFAGPLGNASHFKDVSHAVVIGGGLGSAIAYPQAKALFDKGIETDMIVGFRNKDLIILEKEMSSVCNKLMITTDDGSNGNKGFVTSMLQKQLDDGVKYDLVVAIGPPMMMRAVAELTRPYNIATWVSLNPIMVDGTGMCGGCRVTVDGKVRFACVDGPDFDGHKVDFDELIKRLSMYKAVERKQLENHMCRMEAMKNA